MSTATLNASVSRNIDPNKSASADQDLVLAVIENLRQALLDKNVAQFAAQFAPDTCTTYPAPPSGA